MKSHARQHPTGIAVSATSVLMIISDRAGLGLTVSEAVAIVGFVGAVFSYFTPRTRTA